jgi:hypothetical protein
VLDQGIDSILEHCLRDPVSPEFMAPPERPQTAEGAAAASGVSSEARHRRPEHRSARNASYPRA